MYCMKFAKLKFLNIQVNNWHILANNWHILANNWFSLPVEQSIQWLQPCPCEVGRTWGDRGDWDSDHNRHSIDYGPVVILLI